MLFSSTIFIFLFLPIVIFIYYVILRNRSLRNIFLFFASLLFYAWGEPYYVGLMMISILVNYYFGVVISRHKASNEFKSGVTMTLVCVYNLGVLIILKYLAFFITNINSIFGKSFYVPHIALPIGISFFTFQAMSYVVDVYRKKAIAQSNPIYVGLYITFFPQLIAGPIVRYETVADEIQNRKESFDDFSAGVCRFIIGLSKKVLLSNTLSIVADSAFAITERGNLSLGFAWLGAISFALQIFFDFSGYSDMAIGLGRMFGFHFDENFNYPYTAKSITDFWRRWHISLSTWFRDYVYIPIGGGKGSIISQIRNLFIVWLLTGIWHGASWNFMFWGLLYFIVLVLEKYIIKPNLFRKKFAVGLYRIFTLIVITFSWVLFRAVGLRNAIKYSLSMLGFMGNPLYDNHFIMYFKENIFCFIIGIILCCPIGNIIQYKFGKSEKTSKVIIGLLPLAYIILFILCSSFLVKGTFNPFIYFNF